MRHKLRVKMKILITGGAGYIASHTLKALLEQNKHEICVIDNLYSGSLNAIKTLKNIGNFNFFKLDLSDESELEKLFKAQNFEAVLHFAAFIEVAESMKNPLKYYLNNTANTAKLINLASKNGVKYFIFSSTAAVYGEPKSAFVDEKSPLCPINPYGRSKMMSEQILQDCQNFKYAILRYFNVAGASVDGLIGQNYPNATHLIKVICQCITKKRENISIFGNDYDTADGTCIRDYIHIEDLANAHLSALDYLKSRQKSEIFNVGYGRGFSVSEVIQAAKRVSGVDFSVLNAPRRQGDPIKLVANANKLKELTSWRAQHNSLDEIIKTALEWEKKL